MLIGIVSSQATLTDATWICNTISIGNEFLSISVAAPELGTKMLDAKRNRAAESESDGEIPII